MALHRLLSCCCFVHLFAAAQKTGSGDTLPDDIPYNMALFAGTHNSAVNLGGDTLLRPSDAEHGGYPSEAHSAYQYPIMDQRLSIRDQLEQGIRVLDFEVAALNSKWTCKDTSSDLSAKKVESDPDTCVEEIHLTSGRCFRNCPFIVSHGSLDESIGDHLGYTYPETLFKSVAAFVKENPREIVTIMLIATHGNSFPAPSEVTRRMNATGLLQHIWNADPSAPFDSFPTLGEMRSAGQTVLLVNGYGHWGPQFHGSHCNSSDIVGADSTCAGGTPCMEGWDAVTFDQLDPSRAILSKTPPHGNGKNSTVVFVIENLSSRRGRDKHSAKYWPLPNELHDVPFQAGGNPAQAAMAADYTHVRGLEAAWAKLLNPFGILPTWILVDFFNTTTPQLGKPSRSLKPNPNEGLVRAVQEINTERVAHWRASADRRKASVII